MLDMNLIQERLALKVEFQLSLAADIFEALSLVVESPFIEGIDQWAYETHAALSPALKSDMEIALVLVAKSGIHALWVSQLPPDASAHHDFAALITWLNTFTADDYRVLTKQTLAHLAAYCEEEQTQPPSFETADILRTALGEKFTEEQLQRALDLIQNPSELKAQFLSVVTRFWEQFYRQEYQRCLPLATRSVEYHRQQTYGADFGTVFTSVTGRRVPKDYIGHEDVERLIFIPSCHIGPYVMFNTCEACKHVMMIHYNCRPTGTLEHEPQQEKPAVQDMFPPLKALADETRLQILTLLNGREMYAQEIVNALDISQSAISRHLQLMVTGGLLNIRKEDSMKYFSINTESLDALASQLRSFRGKSTG
jgi:DNA-binding transcriptional ArsR family regulator